MSITSIEGYEAALRRIVELEDFLEGSPHAVELGHLIRAVSEWNRFEENNNPILEIDPPVAR